MPMLLTGGGSRATGRSHAVAQSVAAPCAACADGQWCCALGLLAAAPRRPCWELFPAPRPHSHPSTRTGSGLHLSGPAHPSSSRTCGRLGCSFPGGEADAQTWTPGPSARTKTPPHRHHSLSSTRLGTPSQPAFAQSPRKIPWHASEGRSSQCLPTKSCPACVARCGARCALEANSRRWTE